MKSIFEHPLAKKIALVTVIKLIGLTVIWWMFFSETNGNNELTTEQVGNAILHPLNRNVTKH